MTVFENRRKSQETPGEEALGGDEGGMEGGSRE